MSREIDTSQPLSDEDRQYLLDRGKNQLVDQIDAEQGDSNAARRAAYIPGMSIDRAAGVPDTPSALPNTVMGGGDTDAEEDEGVEEDADLTAEAVESADNYDTWMVEDLQEELRNRDLPVSGKKKELVARLREDDESSSEG
jgi:hypothetical protein